MKNFKSILWGLVLIAIGVIIALNTLGIADINIFFDGWWTLFIIVPCAINIFTEEQKTGNIIGLLVGVLLLLACQDIFDFSIVWSLLFPAILVIIGVTFIFKNAIFNNRVKKLPESMSNGSGSYNATFSGQKINFDDEKLKNLDLDAVFGGLECDLRNAIIEEDVVITVSAIFGGVDIFVPKNVKVKTTSNSMFGGIESKLRKNEGEHTIYINATCMFGGVNIK